MSRTTPAYYDEGAVVLALEPFLTVEPGIDNSLLSKRDGEADACPESKQYFFGPQYRFDEKNEIRCQQPRKHRMGILIGPSPSLCDIVIHDRSGSEKETPVWGLITYDHSGRLIYRDVRHPVPDEEFDQNKSSGVFFSGKSAPSTRNKDNFRRGFTWVLSGSDYILSQRPKTELVFNKYVTLIVHVPQYQLNSPDYHDHAKAFRGMRGVYEDAPWQYRDALDYYGIDDLDTFLCHEPDPCPDPERCLDPYDMHGASMLACVHPTSKPILLMEKVGYGAFGKVEREYNVATGVSVAVKMPRSKEKFKTTIDEIELFEKIREASTRDKRAAEYAQHIIGYISGTDSPTPSIRLEFAHYGTLSMVRLGMAQGVDALEQVLKASFFLHSIDITHRDIKPDNVLIKRLRQPYKARGDIHIKLADFGVSRSGPLKTTCIGTYVYMAPELFSAGKKDSHIDIWATGVMFFDLCYGLPEPLRDLQIPKTEQEMMKLGPTMCLNMEKAISDKATDYTPKDKALAIFIRDNMVRMEPSMRKSAEQCLYDIQPVYEHCSAITPTPPPAAADQPPADSMHATGYSSAVGRPSRGGSGSYQHGSMSNDVEHYAAGMSHGHEPMADSVPFVVFEEWDDMRDAGTVDGAVYYRND